VTQITCFGGRRSPPIDPFRVGRFPASGRRGGSWILRPRRPSARDHDSMSEAKRTPTTLSASPGFNLKSLEDVGRRLFELSDIEVGLGNSAVGTLAAERLNGERMALTALGMTLRPRTLADATALACIAHGQADALLDSAEAAQCECQVQGLRRALAGIALALDAHGIDIDLLGYRPSRKLCEREFEVGERR
jgi:hypothetical protein